MNTHPAPRFFWLLVGTLLIAAALRLWQIGALPPGLHYDEAADTILAEQIARGESAPIFIEAYTGKEVLFFYWAAAWMKLIGPSVFAMRLAAALIGVLTVAATYRAVSEILDPHPRCRQKPATSATRSLTGMLDPHPRPLSLTERGGRSVALLAAIFIATSFWHVLMSRLGFRSISEPLLQALALAALFRGLRLNQVRWFCAAGALIGLTLYTYLAARLFPVAIALIFLYFGLFERGRRLERLIQFLVTTAAAAIVFAPLGVYFLQHPDAFLTRIQQVAPRGDQAGALIENAGRALGMFFVSGDPYIRFNLPGRPLFPWLLGMLFLAGLIVALIGLFRGRTAQRRGAYFSLIALTIVMLLPTALAVNEITPSNLRAIGLMPAVFVFPALGAWWLIKSILRNLPVGVIPRPPSRGRDALGQKLSRGGSHAAGYAGVEARSAKFLSSAADVSFRAARGISGPANPAARLAQRFLAPLGMTLTTGMTLLLVVTALEVSVTYFGQYVTEPQLYIQSDGDLADIAAALNRTDTRRDQVYIAALHYRHPTVAALAEHYGDYKWLSGNRVIVLPNGPADLFFARLALPDETWSARFLPDSALIDAPLAPDGQPNYRAYHLDAQPAIAPHTQLDVNFGNIIQLIGYDREPNQPASVTLYWRVLNKPDRGDYSTFAQLRDPWSFEWGQAGSFDYPSEEWASGEIIINRIDVPIDAGAPPGDYELRVGLFSQGANQRINIVAADGGFGGTVARLSPLPMERAATDAAQLNIGARLDRDAQPGLKLLGYSLAATSVKQGAPLILTLFWQSTAALKDAPLTLQLSQPQTTMPLTTTSPVQGTYPFGQWSPNEIVADRYRLRAPTDLTPGRYTLEVIVGRGEPIGLGTLELYRGNRVVDEPPIAQRIESRLGDAIELVGYNLNRTAGTIRLDLIWLALRPIDHDYTVFTHALDGMGRTIGGQDNQPVKGAYPTSWWIPGEYVSDTYTLPPADTIDVGLYDPETGARLGATIRLR